MSKIIEKIFSFKKLKLSQKFFLGFFRTHLNVKKCFFNNSRWFTLAAAFWKKSSKILLKTVEISATFFLRRLKNLEDGRYIGRYDIKSILLPQSLAKKILGPIGQLFMKKIQKIIPPPKKKIPFLGGRR